MTNVSVSAPKVARAEAGYGPRMMAVLLDSLAFYTIIFVISIGWLNIARIPASPAVEAPPQMEALIVVSIGLYLFITALFGRTLGMRAMGLRIVSSGDGSRVGPLRSLSRTLVLLIAIGLIIVVHPALFVAYSLWMLFNTRRQLLHDQVAGTVVIRTSASRSTGGTVPFAEPSSGSLEPPQAQALLDELDRVRRRAQGDLHAASVPLFVLGLLAIGGVVAGWDTFGYFSWLYWTLAAPVGLIVTGWWFRRLRRSQGAGTGVGPLVVITILVTCASVAFSIFMIGGVITALGFLAYALTQSNRVLAVAAVIFGLVAGMEQPLGFISNGVYNHFPNAGSVWILEYHGSAIVFAVLAVSLVAAGATYLRRERVCAPDHR